MKTDAFVLKKLLSSLKEDVSNVPNLNTGISLTKDAKTAQKELITHLKVKDVKLVPLKHHSGTEDIA